MTVIDRYDNFMAKYIRRSIAKDDPVDKSESVDSMLEPDEWGSELNKYEPVVDDGIKRHSMNAVLCRRMALTSPLFCKGVWKKSMDTFRAGNTINKEGKEPTGREKVWINAFNKRNDIFKFLATMKICNHIYGYAPVYIRFVEEIQSREINHSSAPKESYEPFKVYMLDPEKVKKFVYKNQYWKRKGVKHLLYITSSGKEVYIHPDRLEIVAEKQLPFSMFGISDIIILRHIISSNADIDIAVGKILKWFSYGTREWKKEGANPDERKEMRKIMKLHPDVITSDMDYEFKIHTPEAIDPAPFYDYIMLAIAAVLVMPTHILKGIEVGRVTGAEAGYSDYHKDITDVQQLVYNPFLYKLYQRIFSAHNTKDKRYIFDYDIEWNPTYVNEMAEAELLLKRALAVEKMLGKDHPPIIEIDEAREILKRGYIKFDKSADEIKTPPKQAPAQVKEYLTAYADLEMKKSQIKKLKEELDSDGGSGD